MPSLPSVGRGRSRGHSGRWLSSRPDLRPDRNTVNGQGFCTTHKSQTVYHGPVVYLDDPVRRLERAPSDLAFLLLDQREYRSAVWAEDEPAEDVLDLDDSPGLADAMRKPRVWTNQLDWVKKEMGRGCRSHGLVLIPPPAEASIKDPPFGRRRVRGPNRQRVVARRSFKSAMHEAVAVARPQQNPSKREYMTTVSETATLCPLFAAWHTWDTAR